MNALLEKCPERRSAFSVLLNRTEYDLLENLSQSLSISKGSVIRISLKNLMNTKDAGKVTTPFEVDCLNDSFWKNFKGG